MFKVECPGCKAPYQVDERRIPSNGLKMRCPKCGTSFNVEPPSDPRRTGPSLVLGGAFGLADNSVPPPPPAAADASKGTMLGVAPARSAALKGTMLGIAPVSLGTPGPERAAPTAMAGQLPVTPPADEPALPAVAPVQPQRPGAARPPVPPRVPRPAGAAAPGAGPPGHAPPAAPAAGTEQAVRDADLPAVGRAVGIDLPSPRGAAGATPRHPAAPALPSREQSAALPAAPPPPQRSGASPAAPTPPQRSAASPAAPAPPQRSAASPQAPQPSSPFELDELDLDLPAAAGASAASAELPSAVRERGAIDLPSISRAQGNLPTPQTAGLPVPRASAVAAAPASFDFAPDVDLPDVGVADLPSIGGHVDLPESAEVELPTLGGGLPAVSQGSRSAAYGGRTIDLPSLGGELPSLGGDLPSVGGNLPSVGGNLPSVGGSLPALGGTLPAVASALPALGGGLPSPQASPSIPSGASPSLPPALGFPPNPSPARGMTPPGGFGEIELPLTGSVPPASPAPAFSEIDLGLSPSAGAPPARAYSGSFDALDADPFGEAPLPGPHSTPAARPPLQASVPPAPANLHRQTGGGGTDYGEVSLDSSASSAEVALEAAPRPPPPPAPDDDMEFGAVPQETQARPVAASAASTAKGPAGVKDARRGRLITKIAAGVFVLGLGGASLALLPNVGPFGAFFIVDQLKAGEYQQLLDSSAKAASEALALDTYPDAKRAAQIVGKSQANARRAKPLSALAAYVGFLSDLRFGREPAAHARSVVLLDELAEEQDVAMLELARAARAASEGQIARARQLLRGAGSASAIEKAVLSGEIELRASDGKAALGAWQRARQLDDSPRTVYGAARAKLLAGDTAGALGDVEAVLAANAKHVGARLLIARHSLGSRDGEARAASLLDSVLKDEQQASPEELVSAHTLLGELHLGRSRISAAEAAFGAALKINPKAAPALIGLGDALYRAGRYSEAQARFEAGTQADPDNLAAKVGVAKSKLSLERVQEAGALLQKLREAHPKSPLVGYWYGRVQEALGARDQALAAYRDVLRVAPDDPASADVYIALALLQNQLGRPDEAQKTLDSAKSIMPKVPGVWRALGDLALSQGRYKEALADFERASELDPDDLGSKFRIGSALRRDGQFERASKVFDGVAALDRDYPGLALERGLLFEASGRSEEALKQYEDALAKAPNDPDLMLRVGCGKVAAQRAEQAEELLRKVLSQRPSSAETHHCLGRALLVQGTRLADALRMLERAVELDPNRAEHYLYVGWAANEAGNVPKAERALAEALRLDQGLADAYWQRGVLRQRQGAVRDAITDLTRALQLRPSRFEAHAALADAYYDLGRESEALREWQQAIEANGDNPTWRFRYGKLLAINRMNEAAVEQLRKSLSLTESVEPPPRWHWEAHHTLARALGPTPDAIKHWEEFLRLGPRDSPYRSEAKAMLEKLGKPWLGD